MPELALHDALLQPSSANHTISGRGGTTRGRGAVATRSRNARREGKWQKTLERCPCLLGRMAACCPYAEGIVAHGGDRRGEGPHGNDGGRHAGLSGRADAGRRGAPGGVLTDVALAEGQPEAGRRRLPSGDPGSEPRRGPGVVRAEVLRRSPVRRGRAWDRHPADRGGKGSGASPQPPAPPALEPAAGGAGPAASPRRPRGP